MLDFMSDYIWTKHRKTLTPDRHSIPGIGDITHVHSPSSLPPSPLHFHGNYIEVHCMINGSRNSIIHENNGIQSYTVDANEVFLVYPFELHNNGERPQQPCEYYAFQLDIRDPEHMVCLDKECSSLLYQQIFALKHRHFQMNDNDIYLLRAAYSSFYANPDEMPSPNRSGVYYLTCFLFNLLQMPPVKARTSTIGSMQPVLDYIDHHITKTIMVEELAQVSGYSPTQFNMKFKKELGFTPSEYVTLRKVEEAKHFLETTEISIVDLAFELGFSSSNYFASVFKKILGCSPREYRKQFQHATTQSN